MKRALQWLLTFLVLLTLVPSPIRAQAPHEVTLPQGAGQITAMRVVSSNSEGVVFELTVPWESLELASVTVAGEPYTHVNLPGWVNEQLPGLPSLPVYTAALGAPFGADVTVAVEPGVAHTMGLAAPLLPAARQEAVWGLPAPKTGALPAPATQLVVAPDPAAYGAAQYPQALATLPTDGVMRQQRVLGVNVYPIAYAPVRGELTVYESLRVTVRFAGGAVSGEAATAAALDDTPWSASLLNGDAARAWRQTPADREGVNAATGVVSGAVAPWAPPVPGWKITVRDEGLYRLTYDDLLGAGVPVDTLLPDTLQLFYREAEVAIEVTGAADGSFDPGDTLVFYGQALGDKYTADNIYWLTYGAGTGLRMNTRDGAPGEADAAAYGQAELRLEQNRYYWSSVPGDELLDRWLWDYVYRSSSAPVSVNKTFALASPFAAEATMTVALLGYTASATSPDHHATISVNGTAVGGVWWDGMTWATATVTVPAGVLLPGNNTVTVTSQPDTGLSQDVFYVDWIELAYATSLTAQGNALAWTYSAPGARRFAVAGFSQSSVAVYDVTNPAAVARLTSVAITGGAGNYTADFQDTISVPIAYRAVSDGAYRAVAGIVADTPSDLATAVMGADHLIITHSAFAAAAETLRAFRAASGLNAVLVDVQDVYDEFGYGIVGPQAIRAFVAYAYASGGEAAPAYVLLVGDGHYDPKHYDAGTRPSYIPPYLAPVDPWIGETAADNRYVTVDGADTMPDLMLGRLAVNSPAEAAAFVDKIIAYEQSPAPGPWQKQILAVADNADDGGNFPVLSNNLLAASVPAYGATKVYLGITHLTAGAARTAIQSALNSGKAFVNYIGHAYNKAWASEDLLTTADVNGLSNGDMLPVVLAMTCRDGSYHQPLDYTPSATGEEALAEVITRVAGKGAVASWSPTGLGVASGHDHLNRGFYEAFFQDYVGTVGAATAAGKLRLWSTGADLDLLDTYLLFGDPAMTIVNAPEPVEIANFDATATGHDIMLSWQATTEGEVAGYNLWRAASPAGATVKVNDALLPVSASGQVTNIYEFTDTAPEVCTVSYYWLEVVKTSGVSDWYGPQEAEGFCRRVYQPVVRDGKAMDPQ